MKQKSSSSVPIGFAWRCSTIFIASTVGFGILVDYAAYSLPTTVIPLELEVLGYDNVGGLTGWIQASYAAGLIVSSPPCGYLAGVLKNRQWPLVVGLLFMAGGSVLFMESNTFGMMLAARIIQGCAGTAIWTFGMALTTDSVPHERVGSVMGLQMIALSAGNLLGPPVGGALYDKFGFRAPMVFALILVAVDLVLRFLIIEKRPAAKILLANPEYDLPKFEAPKEVMELLETRKRRNNIDPQGANETVEEVTGKQKEPKASSKQAAKGMLLMLTSWRANTLLALTLLSGFMLVGLFETGLTIHVVELYGMSASQAGLLFIAIIVPYAALGPLSGWLADRRGGKLTMSIGLGMFTVSVFLLIIRTHLAAFIVFLACAGAGLAVTLTPILQDLASVVHVIPGLSSGHAYSTFNGVFSLGAFLGPIIIGQFYDGLGDVWGWTASCIFLGGCSAAVLPFVILFAGGRKEQLEAKKLTAYTKKDESTGADVELGERDATSHDCTDDALRSGDVQVPPFLTQQPAPEPEVAR